MNLSAEHLLLGVIQLLELASPFVVVLDLATLLHKTLQVLGLLSSLFSFALGVCLLLLLEFCFDQFGFLLHFGFLLLCFLLHLLLLRPQPFFGTFTTTTATSSPASPATKRGRCPSQLVTACAPLKCSSRDLG